MGAGHGHRLHYHGHSGLHRLPAQCKIIALVPVRARASWRRRAPSYWAYGLDAVALLAVVAWSQVPFGYIGPADGGRDCRSSCSPLLLPFIALGPRTEFLGLTRVRESGLRRLGSTLLCKATLGVVAGLLLAATTEPRDIIAGLEGKLPRADRPDHGDDGALPRRHVRPAAPDADRAGVARVRGAQPAALAGAGAGAGALFVRSYERGERVHLAMLSRGYTGSLAGLRHRRGDRPRLGRRSLLLPLAAVVAALWLLGRCDEPGEPVLEVRDLAYAYPDGHQALFGVNLAVARGERVALLGPNGAGKTTLVLHLNGILEAGHGQSTVAGLRVGTEHVAEVRRRVGLVFQDPDDQLFMPTVADDVAFGPANAGLKGAELDARVAARARAGRDGRVRQPAAAPPVVRPAAAGGRRDRARHAAGDPGARRAVVQPRPGEPPGAGRHPARARHHGA